MRFSMAIKPKSPTLNVQKGAYCIKLRKVFEFDYSKGFFLFIFKK